MNLRLHLLLALACVIAPVAAQDLPRQPPPDTRTGDAWIDRQLDDINRYGTRYRDTFVDELVRYHGAPRALVLDLLERKWPPGDIYYACALGTVAGRPCRHVVDQYTHGEGQDWQATAQRIGVEVDSPQFRRLKQGLVATYGRWGRPIESEKVPVSKPEYEQPRKHDVPPVPSPVTGLRLVPPPETSQDDAKRSDAKRRSDDRLREDR